MKHRHKINLICSGKNLTASPRWRELLRSFDELPDCGARGEREWLQSLLAGKAPMLATPYRPDSVALWPKPFLCQLMPSGLRAILLRSDGLMLDGQIFVAGWSHLQHLRHNQSEEAWPDESRLQIFDVINSATQATRLYQLKLLFDRAVAADFEPLFPLLVEQVDGLIPIARLARKHGAMGLVLRNAQGLYKLGSRSGDLVRLAADTLELGEEK